MKKISMKLWKKYGKKHTNNFIYVNQMSYQFVDVLTFGKINCKKILPEYMCTIFVDKKLYDTDLLIGLETKDDAIRQLKIDAPRSIFNYKGTRMKTVPDGIPHSLIPYCTQCVMGLPVTILFENLGLVYESGKPMLVSVKNDESVYIFKTLKVRNESQDIDYTVYIHITVKKNEMVEIKFAFKQV